MELTISYNKDEEKEVVELLQTMFRSPEDAWREEEALAARPGDLPSRVFIPHSLCRGGIVIF